MLLCVVNFVSLLYTYIQYVRLTSVGVNFLFNNYYINYVIL